MTVHFPIAFYLLGVGLALLHWRRGEPELDRLARWSFGLSWLFTLVASMAGLIDQNRLALNDPRQVSVNTHITAAVILLILTGLLLYWRQRWPKRCRLYWGLMAAGTAALLVTARLGGDLVFRLAIGVQPWK